MSNKKRYDSKLINPFQAIISLSNFLFRTRVAQTANRTSPFILAIRTRKCFPGSFLKSSDLWKLNTILYYSPNFTHCKYFFLARGVGAETALPQVAMVTRSTRFGCGKRGLRPRGHGHFDKTGMFPLNRSLLRNAKPTVSARQSKGTANPATCPRGLRAKKDKGDGFLRPLCLWGNHKI